MKSDDAGQSVETVVSTHTQTGSVTPPPAVSLSPGPTLSGNIKPSGLTGTANN